MLFSLIDVTYRTGVMTIKSHTITYSLNRNQSANGFLIAQSDALVGFAFADPMGRLTFFSFDARVKEMERMAFRSIEEVEASLATYLGATPE